MGVLLLAVGAVAFRGPQSSIGVEDAVSYFRREIKPFAVCAAALDVAVRHLDTTNASLVRAREAFLLCRLRYKHISFFIDYFFPSEAMVYNAPAKYEIEEPFMEFQTPVGLQVIEALLYDRDVYGHKVALLQQTHLIAQSAADLPSLLYGFQATDKQVLESVRLELIRIMVLSITGYDAPLQKSGVAEAALSLRGLEEVLRSYVAGYAGRDSLSIYLHGALGMMDSCRAFDDFDRLGFLSRWGVPLQRCVNRMAWASGFFYNTVPALSDSAADIFSAGALNKQAFPHGDGGVDNMAVLLGRRLFAEKALSGNGTRSCVSCHLPGDAFAEPLARHATYDGEGVLPRNAPGLMYGCYQYAQFWDGRANGLEQQIRMVLTSPMEMHGDLDSVVARLQRMDGYSTMFGRAWPAAPLVTVDHVAGAIAAYLRRLTPFRSAFDAYMQGDHGAMTVAQQRGFNLFMGKALCGTCHFAPVFNGLTPPLYGMTEFEVLGTPLTDDLSVPVRDLDSGRAAFFSISFYAQAFKTPTVRNAAVTAPYMHHGAFRDLARVVEFYDKGGGVGMGLKVENQTLAAEPLKLTEGEKKDLVAFMEALTDR